MFAKEQIKEKLSGPLAVSISLYFKRPKSHYGTGKNAGMLKASAPARHVQTPDVDNCIKFIFDCLNGLAWDDDKQIVGLFTEKSWRDYDSTHIWIHHACVWMTSAGTVWGDNGWTHAQRITTLREPKRRRENDGG